MNVVVADRPEIKAFLHREIENASGLERDQEVLDGHAIAELGCAGPSEIAAALHDEESDLEGEHARAGEDELEDIVARLRDAERGEHAALKTYKDALNGMLPPTVTDLVEAQCEAIQDANERIRTVDTGHA